MFVNTMLLNVKASRRPLAHKEI